MSLGGFLSQLIALKYPDRVKTLTLIASERLRDTDPEMPSMDPKILEYHERAGEVDWTNKQSVVEYQIGAWRLLSGSAHSFNENDIKEMAESDFERTPNLLAGFNHASLTGGNRWFDRLNEIKQPALIIHGTEDPILPYKHALALKSELPNSKFFGRFRS